MKKQILTVPELLAPCGDLERLKTALYFGADAVYLGGKNFGLRVNCDNFDDLELKTAVNLVHSKGKKLYVTLNILAFNGDFLLLKDYVLYLESINVDAVIVSDLGVLEFVKKHAPALKIHVSTQSSVTNKYAALCYANLGAERIVLGREVPLCDIAEIRSFLPKEVGLEAFVHGAMCVAYSGRCLLSAYFTSRSGNRGACAQSCRWEYTLTEQQRKGEEMPIVEDGRGTYILSSKDMNMINHLDELTAAGVDSFKIEGRAKTVYYVATIINAYRRAIDLTISGGRPRTSAPTIDDLYAETLKTSHRPYYTGFYFDDKDSVAHDSNQPQSTHKFVAIVVPRRDAHCASAPSAENYITVEQRNRFKIGDVLEVLSPTDSFNKTIKVEKMTDEKGVEITDALNVQQLINIKTDLKLNPGDILRVKLAAV